MASIIEMRGNLFEKPNGDNSYADHLRKHQWRVHYNQHPFSYFVGRWVLTLFILFLLSIPLAYIATKITPENLALMNHNAEKYLNMLSSYTRWVKIRGH